MRFALTEQQRSLRDGLRDLLADTDGAVLTQEWSSGRCGSGHALWKQLVEMGLPGVALPEEHGGLGLGLVELVTCLGELGYAGVPGPYVEAMAAVPAALRTPGVNGEPRLRGLVSGEMVTMVPPGSRYAADADQCVAVYWCEGLTSGAAPTVRVDTRAGLFAEPAVDGARRWHSVQPGDNAETIAEGASATAAASAAFDHGALAAAAQLLGLGRRLLDLATDHAGQRHQFGRPIGEFQAIKHQLADVLLELEYARPLVHAACLSLQAGAPSAPRDVSAAKIAAGDAAHRAARTALQVHGALGYTAEHELHRWLAKVRVLRSSWGTPARHRRRVAQALDDGLVANIGEH